MMKKECMYTRKKLLFFDFSRVDYEAGYFWPCPRPCCPISAGSHLELTKMAPRVARLCKRMLSQFIISQKGKRCSKAILTRKQIVLGSIPKHFKIAETCQIVSVSSHRCTLSHHAQITMNALVLRPISRLVLVGLDHLLYIIPTISVLV